jgi:FKBP-type peptidyl-prolyl cis-trans isomerase FkpA/FKBP-type peptidyl-prolyl cis-trans isomerase FklB
MDGTSNTGIKTTISIIIIIVVVIGLALLLRHKANKAEAPVPTTQETQTTETTPTSSVSSESSDGKTSTKANMETHTTASGLQYKVIREGSGPKPTAAQTVEVNYEGKLTDGKVFDSSYARGQSISFPLNRVIKGWTEGLQLMSVGSEYEFTIPGDLAYGAQGIPGTIPPNATLIFKVELLGVK